MIGAVVCTDVGNTGLFLLEEGATRDPKNVSNFL